MENKVFGNLQRSVPKAFNVSWLIVALIFFASWVFGSMRLQGESARKRPFVVADDIRLAQFDDFLLGSPAIVISPNRRLAAVRVQRGLLKKDRLQDEIRVYKLGALRRFIETGEERQPPAPLWRFVAATCSEGELISKMQWISDSRHLGFLLKDSDGDYQLLLSDLRHPQPRALSLKGQDVTAFDIRDRTHYVYAVRSLDVFDKRKQEQYLPAVDVTGRAFADYLFPDYAVSFGDRSTLWAAIGDAPHLVTQPNGRKPFILYYEGQHSMALSPNGQVVALAMPVENVPQNWDRLYATPKANDAYHIHPGRQNLNSDTGVMLVSQYATINLRTGSRHFLVDAPTGRSADWVAGGITQMTWSSNGHYLALPSTFGGTATTAPNTSAPCLAVADIEANSIQCLEDIKAPHTRAGTPNPQYFFIDRLAFAGSSLVMHYLRYDQTKGIHTFVNNSGRWQRITAIPPPALPRVINVTVREGLNLPPVLVATDDNSHRSRVVWNPNPQLTNVEQTAATIYHWIDTSGRRWTGGLYEPPNYEVGRRYPLVIQTHGFTDKVFAPSGTMSTAFAARALAAIGIVVLQVRGCPVNVSDTEREAPCNVQGYEAAIRALAEKGIIDLNRVGIIGFSRTCYYAMQALTASQVHFQAASITDGVDFGYWQYLLSVDLNHGALGDESEAIYHAKPFGNGLLQWVNHSPEFKLHRIRTPLLVVGEGGASILEMWEPYAALRYLHKPVDLVLLHTDEHILSNPAVLMASQTGTVDWFRFWLQGYEDPTPSRRAQYLRWETLCTLQSAENPHEVEYCVKSSR